MHLQKSLGISTLDREFPSWSLRKTEESRARIAVDQEIEATSSLKDLINPKSITGNDVSDYEEFCIRWWRQNWNGATILLIWSTKLASVEPWQDKKGEKTLTPSGRLKNVFSGRQLGLVQEETLVVFFTRVPRETVRTSWDEVERRKKISPRARVLFSTESEDTDWREKLEQSKGQFCDWSSKSHVYGGQDEKDRRLILEIVPYVVVTSLETEAFMAVVAYFDMLTVDGNPARVRKKKVLKLWEEKKGPRLCISKISSNELCSTESWRIGTERSFGTRHEILRMHLVQN